MPVVVPDPVLKTDNFDQWRQKCNGLVTAVLTIVNEGEFDTLIQLSEPINDGDMLLYDTNTSTFNNVLFETVILDYLTAEGYRPDSNVKKFYLANLHNLF